MISHAESLEEDEDDDECECPVCRAPIEFYLQNTILQRGLDRSRCVECGSRFGYLRQPYVINPCGHNICSLCKDDVQICKTCHVGVESTVKNYLGCQMIEREYERNVVSDEEMPGYVNDMVELYEHFKKYEDIVSTWDDITLPSNLSSVDKPIWNRMMRLVQSSAVKGACTNDYMALGFPPFLTYPIESLRKKVDMCLQLRKTRPWARKMEVSIFCPL